MKNLWLIPAAMIALICACAKQSPEPTTAPPTDAKQAPLREESPASDVVRAKLTAGGIPAQYSAHFEAKQLARIVESRPTADGTVTGEYQFQGARLIRYRGAKLGSSGAIDLQFDMQGVLQPGVGPTPNVDEIRSIRGRGQLLRNHALAQRSTRTHAP